MAVEKEKVIARYKLLFGSVGLSQTRLDEISAKLGLKLADDATDEDIDARLNEQNDIYPFMEIKKHDDRIANEKKNPNKQKQKEEEEDKKPEPKEDEEMPSWAKTLLTKVEGLESARTAETLEARFRADARVKDVPEFVLKRSIPKSEEEYEEVANELHTEYKDFAEKNKLAAFGGDQTPEGTKTNGQVKVKSVDETKALADSI